MSTMLCAAQGAPRAPTAMRRREFLSSRECKAGLERPRRGRSVRSQLPSSLLLPSSIWLRPIALWEQEAPRKR